MEIKANLLTDLIEHENIHPLIKMYFEFNHLKNLYRQGWLKQDIPIDKCESVADHSFGVAVLAFIIAREYFPNLDSNRILHMALLHDVGEVYAGDFTPADNVTPQEKRKQEKQSLEKIFSKLPSGERYLELWKEFEDGSSREAQLVRDVDLLEMKLQACVYERQGYSNLQDFFNSDNHKSDFPPLSRFFEDIAELHNLTSD